MAEKLAKTRENRCFLLVFQLLLPRISMHPDKFSIVGSHTLAR